MLYIKDGQIKPKKSIIIYTEEYIICNPSEEMILADGWQKYEPESVTPPEPVETIDDQIKNYILNSYNNRTDITDEEALSMPLLVYPWGNYLNKSLKAGQIVSYNEVIYRVRQDVPVVLEDQFPSNNTAALYGAIELAATGTIDDPINYTPPMEIFNGKYYKQNDVLYLCTRDSGQELSFNLSDLVGIYVQVV